MTEKRLTSSALMLRGVILAATAQKRTRTRLRPGALSPGGTGVDIKHNSYHRYLARLKGKGPVLQERVPSYFAEDLPFNPAFPVYGGKTFKTSIVAGCVCDGKNNKDVYKNTAEEELNTAMFSLDKYTYESNCVCPVVVCLPQNQYYGYSQTDTFLLQCQYELVCGEIVPIL